MAKLGRPFDQARMLARLEKAKASKKKTRPPHPNAGNFGTKEPFTPSEILFEIQMQLRGYIEVDLVLRTTDPFKRERHLVGEPTRIRGLEPGEIMKLRRDLQAWLIHWRAQLALERKDGAVESRMQIA